MLAALADVEAANDLRALMITGRGPLFVPAAI